MKAREVMTHCVVTIAPEASVGDAISRMVSHQVSGMPVVDAHGAVVGVVSEGDFLRRGELHTEAPRRRWVELLVGPGGPADEYARSHGRTVDEVMSRNVVSVGPEAPLSDIVALMDEHSIKRVPVIEQGRLVGIVSRADLMTALAAALGAPKAATNPDGTLRERLVREMKKQSWCPVHCIDVAVRNGAVTLKGQVFDERQRRALHVLVENATGTKSLRDELTLLEPITGMPVPVGNAS